MRKKGVKCITQTADGVDIVCAWGDLGNQENEDTVGERRYRSEIS